MAKQRKKGRLRRKLLRAFLKFVIWVMMVALMVTVLVGSVTAVFYFNTGWDDLPSAQVTFGGQTLQVNGCDWTAPVLGGVINKRLHRLEDLDQQQLEVIETAHPELVLPDDLAEKGIVSLTLTGPDGETVYEGDQTGYEQVQLARNGSYAGTLSVKVEPETGKPYGEYTYRFRFEVDLEWQFAISAQQVDQGDVVAVAVAGLAAGETPTVESNLGTAHFVRRDDVMIAYIPVAYNREDGDYEVTVTAGSRSQTFPVEVRYVQFPRVWLDTAVLNDTTGTGTAQFQTEIWPLYNTWEDASWWGGIFQTPVMSAEGAEIYSDYGSVETIGQMTGTSRNPGITYSCREGGMAVAPADGKVVYAGWLEMAGGTVVIEHGAGLKSYLYCLSDVQVQVGQEVKAGDQVGATSAFLQYDLKIGNQSIDPNDAFRGTGGLFWHPELG